MKISASDSIYNTGPRRSGDVFLYNKLMKLEAKLDKACGTIHEQKKEIKALKKENQKLKDENAKLKSIIKNNSKNSSMPPSTDQKPSRAPNTYNSREKSGKRPGGQPGRTGITLTSKKVREGIVSGLYEHRYVTRPDVQAKYIIDLDIRVVAYENLTVGVGNYAVYGDNLRSITVDLYSEGTMPMERIQTFLSSLSQNKLNLSLGTIANSIGRFACLAIPSTAEIVKNLLSSNAIYTEGTNVSMDGRNSYIRNQSTEHSVLYSPMQKKNISELKEKTILDGYGGTLIHDHETALYHFGIAHAECNAHILRYLTKNNEETDNTWSKELTNLLIQMNLDRKSEQDQGVQAFTNTELAEYEQDYDRILASGLEQNKLTKPRCIQQEERSLLNRLRKYKDATLRFLYDFNIAFTNNMSERDLRKCKNKQKSSGGFRKQSGIQNYCTIMSIIETCKRRNLNVMDSIKRILQGEVLFAGE